MGLQSNCSQVLASLFLAVDVYILGSSAAQCLPELSGSVWFTLAPERFLEAPGGEFQQHSITLAFLLSVNQDCAEGQLRVAGTASVCRSTSLIGCMGSYLQE